MREADGLERLGVCKCLGGSGKETINGGFVYGSRFRITFALDSPIVARFRASDKVNTNIFATKIFPRGEIFPHPNRLQFVETWVGL